MDVETDETGWGPAMRALTEMQRRFVLAMASDPFGNQADWARAAGYSDASSGAKVKGHLLMQSPKVEAAVFEFARSTLHTFGPMLASAAMLKIAADPKHPKHLRAVEMIANRVGLHETTEHVVSVNHTDQTGAALAERIKRLGEKYGMDVRKLLGTPVEAEFKVIDGNDANAIRAETDRG